MKFNIAGLTDDLQYIAKGHVYGVAVTNPYWFDDILCQLACNHLVLLTYKEPIEYYARLIEKTDNTLTVFQVNKNKIINNKVDINRLCLELEHQLTNNALILIDFAELMLSVGKTAYQQIQKLKDFCRVSGHSIILLVNHGVTQQGISEEWQELAGFVMVKGIERPQSWHVRHWGGQQYIVSQIHFDIVYKNDEFQLVNWSNDTKITYNDEVNVAHVIVDMHYAELGEGLNKNWLLTDNIAQLKQHVLANNQATVLLHIYQNDNLKTLAALIYSLRRGSGKKLKIIINEVGFKLRLTECCLLKNLGANIILPADLRIVTLTSIISAINKLTYQDKLSDDFELAYKSAYIPETIGYLLPTIFIQNVKAMLTSAASHNIDFALVNLIVPPGINPQDTVKFCKFNRVGDIFTIVGPSVYVFLYGCKNENIDSTLVYIFGTQIAILFKAQENFIYIDRTQLKLLKLEQDFKRFSIQRGKSPIFEQPSFNKDIPTVPPAKFVAKPAQLIELTLTKDSE